MRTVDTLLAMEDIVILYQYLYMNENNFITIDNKVAKFEIRMTEKGLFTAKNLNFPDLPPLNYTDMMTINNMMGIISQLKEVPPIEFDRFSSRWEELQAITLLNVCHNKMKRG